MDLQVGPLFHQGGEAGLLPIRQRRGRAGRLEIIETRQSLGLGTVNLGRVVN